MEWSAVAVLVASLTAPPATDLAHFPPAAEVQAAWKFNRTYRSHLEWERALNPRHYWVYTEILAETDALFALWDCLDDAQRATTELERRRQLGRLRCLLGPDLYARGALPPPAPIWRFRRNDD